MKGFIRLSSSFDYDFRFKLANTVESILTSEKLEKVFSKLFSWERIYCFRKGKHAITHIKGVQIKHLLNFSFLLILITLNRIIKSETYSIQQLFKKLTTIALPIVFITTRNFSIQKDLSISA